MNRSLVFATTLALTIAASVAAVGAPLGASVAFADTIAITDASVYVSPDRLLDRATVVITDGVVTAVGVDVAAPAGARKIDGRGKVVTAGLIDSSCQLGLVEIELENASADGRFGTAPSPIHAAFRTVDAFDARSAAIPVARTGGVTSVVAGPVGGLVAGQSAWVALADAPEPPAPLAAPAGMNAALGAGAVAQGSRGQAVERLREVLDDAERYDRTKAAYDRNQSRELAAARLDLEALLPVLRGRVPLVVHANAESDIRAALALAKERRLRLIVAGGTEAWRVAPALAAAKVPVILDPTANLPGELTATDVRDDNAAILARAGVPVMISTLSEASAVRTLRQLAGVAVANGLPWEKALAAITSVPASAFGQPARGVIARGSPGDLVLWSGDPLELTTRAEVVLVGGVPQTLASHQSRLLERYRRVPPK